MIGRRLWRFTNVSARTFHFVRHRDLRRWALGCFGVEPLVDGMQAGTNGFILVLYWTGWPYTKK